MPRASLSAGRRRATLGREAGPSLDAELAILLARDYYTRGTLIALEKQYPEFDKDGLYSLAAAAVAAA